MKAAPNKRPRASRGRTTMSTRATLKTLRQFECRNLVCADPTQSWPIVWDRAKNTRVWSPENIRYLDLTAAFGVAAAGHANPAIVRAARRQLGQLVHAMGDVHPHPAKARLARALSALSFERWTRAATRKSHGKTIFANSGFEAVEAALKTAFLATNRKGVIAFEGAYHGLGYGALNATHRPEFRAPFRPQLAQFARFVPYPDSAFPHSTAQTIRAIQSHARSHPIGAILVEPVQGRGGIRVPPPDFLPALRETADQLGALLILDEIYTGFGRTGAWFACEHSKTIPDIICLGKALTGGFPLSACVGHAQLMDRAWPESTGESIHTSTFLGHPVGCAMALAQIAEIKRLKLVKKSAQLGEYLLHRLRQFKSPGPRVFVEARGLGLMAGLRFAHRRSARSNPKPWNTMPLVQAMLRQGFILLPEGPHAEVVSFTPPLTISRAELALAVDQLEALVPRFF